MTSLSTAKETSSTQRPQTCTKVKTNHNYTANENWWRERTPTADASQSNEEISQRLPACRRLLFPLLHAEKGPFPRATKEIGDVCTQAKSTLEVYSQNYLLRCKSYTICTMHVKNIFPIDWGQPISLYTMINNGFYSKLYFAINRLGHR